MFLPTESLYAEVLRRPGLLDRLHGLRVNVAGPSNLAALLNSLQMGFRTLAIEQRSSEVWQVLRAVKTEFGKFGEALASVKKTLDNASNKIGQTEVRIARHAAQPEERRSLARGRRAAGAGRAGIDDAAESSVSASPDEREDPGPGEAIGRRGQTPRAPGADAAIRSPDRACRLRLGASLRPLQDRFVILAAIENADDRDGPQALVDHERDDGAATMVGDAKTRHQIVPAASAHGEIGQFDAAGDDCIHIPRGNRGRSCVAYVVFDAFELFKRFGEKTTA